MENNYMLNPAIPLCIEYITPGSKEKEVQALWESVLWTVFPATDNWMTLTKYQQGVTEPDNVTRKVTLFNGGWSPVDVLMVELKREREKISLEIFENVAHDQLDDCLDESGNHPGTIIFGAVGIGAWVQFFWKEIHGGNCTPFEHPPFHILRDAQQVQGYFDYFKVNIPKMEASDEAPAQPATPHTLLGQPSVSYTLPAQYNVLLSTSSVQTAASSSREPETSARLSHSDITYGYYYVEDGKHFYCTADKTRSKVERPKNEWVFNENGWSDTNREKQWRLWEGGENVSYQ